MKTRVLKFASIHCIGSRFNLASRVCDKVILQTYSNFYGDGLSKIMRFPFLEHELILVFSRSCFWVSGIWGGANWFVLNVVVYFCSPPSLTKPFTLHWVLKKDSFSPVLIDIRRNKGLKNNGTSYCNLYKNAFSCWIYKAKHTARNCPEAIV